MDFASLPLIQTLPLPLILFFIAYYHLLAPRCQTEKQRAYLLSALSSGTMSTLSLPFVWSYVNHGLAKTYLACQEGWLLRLGQFGVVFFGVYLFMDLALGYIRYPNQIGLLTGWIHHVVYIALMAHLFTSTQTPIFMIGAIMELPTFDLAMSNLFPSIRHDLRFLSSFFLIRIAFHIFLLSNVLLPSSWSIYAGSAVPGVTLSLALILHVSWFRGGLHGYLKRQRAAAKSQSQSRKSEAVTTSASKARTGEQIMDDALIDSATKIDETIPANTLPPAPSTSNLGTPEDSPLVTPYTPSHTPFSLRDSYVFPNLPITMPTMPHLPTVSIPALSLSDMSGFKDAVRSRWEEQRGMFAAVRGGRGMGLDLGNLRLRRRRVGKGAAEERDVNGVKIQVQEVKDEL